MRLLPDMMRRCRSARQALALPCVGGCAARASWASDCGAACEQSAARVTAGDGACVHACAHARDGGACVQVMAQIAGEKRLPWEQQGELASERMEALGVFKGAILQLLNRDPQQRPSMQRFYDAANRIFSSRTTIKI
jgi:hypothetical protein